MQMKLHWQKHLREEEKYNMKIVVFSDTHGKINSAIDIINKQNPDMIIHLGDFVRDAEDLRSVFTDIKIEYVAGNNDFYMNVLSEKIISIQNKKILLTHGHNYRIKHGLESIIIKGQQEEVDVVLFGHTHKAYENIENNILYFNPGSLTLPYEKPSYGLIEIKNNKIYSMICSLK